jgi:1-deoxy-D-xylulose-5-phosphate synthase
MATALACPDRPFAIRYPKALAGPFDPAGPPKVPEVGRWSVAKPGSDAAILAVGPMVDLALVAAERLVMEGLSVEVVNCRFVKPLDEEYLSGSLASKTRVLAVEEGCLPGGFGSSILEWKEQRRLAVPVLCMGLPDRFITHGTRAELLNEAGLTAEAIARTLTEGWIRKAAAPRSDSAAF